MRRLAISSFAALALLAFYIPLTAQAANPCNPCSVGHNPCGMSKQANPCNPCSMKKANPCGAGEQNAAKQMDGGQMEQYMIDANGRTMIREHAFDSFQQAANVGAKMWNDKALGTSDLACSSCHTDYGLLNFDRNQNFPHYVEIVGDVVTLDQMINFCMLNPMQAEPFEANSKELTAIAAYFRAYRMQYMREHR